MKVLITDQIADKGLEILRQHAEVDYRPGLSQEQLRSTVKDYEALVVRSQTKVNEDIITAADKLIVVARVGTGVDNIDVEAATERGIYVINSPEGNIVSTAEHTIAMLLAAARNIPRADSLLHTGTWDRELKGIEVRNKTLGIIGLGRVGSEVAQMAKGLYMNVFAYDPMLSEERAERLGLQLVEMKTLLSMADFISVHVPLTSSTRGMIGREQLKLVKPNSIIINCARGGIIDEEALYEAIEKGLVAGAAIDVFSREPAQDNILLKSKKVVVTPHLAASTYEAEVSASIDIAEQVVAVLSGYPPKSPVNAPIVSMEVMSVLGPYVHAGTVIGRIAIQLATGRLKSLTIRYEGDIARENCEPVKVAVLSGLLEMLIEERVNMVNVEAIAADRGLKIAEAKSSTCEHYANMVTVEVHTTSGSTLVAGSSIRGKTYVTRVDDYWLEIEPSDSYMLFTEHKDRPGMVGIVGTLLGAADINISQMHVSSGVRRGGNAMMVLCLDVPIPEDCYKQILSVTDMYKAVIVKLNR